MLYSFLILIFAKTDASVKPITTKIENYKTKIIFLFRVNGLKMGGRVPVLWEGRRGTWEKVIRGSGTQVRPEMHRPGSVMGIWLVGSSSPAFPEEEPILASHKWSHHPVTVVPAGEQQAAGEAMGTL